MSNKMELSPELFGVLITENSNMSQDSVNQYLKANDIETEATLAENSGSEVNICLPYYSWIDNQKAEIIADNDMSASGGIEGIARLSPTIDPGELNDRNWSQFVYNMDVIFGQHRPDLADHTYDGDFDKRNTRMTEVLNANPK